MVSVTGELSWIVIVTAQFWSRLSRSSVVGMSQVAVGDTESTEIVPGA